MHLMYASRNVLSIPADWIWNFCCERDVRAWIGDYGFECVLNVVVMEKGLF